MTGILPLATRAGLGYVGGAVVGGLAVSVLAALGQSAADAVHAPIVVLAGLCGAGVGLVGGRGGSHRPTSNVHGSAHFAASTDPLWSDPNDRGLIVGRQSSGSGSGSGGRSPRPFLRYDGPAHLMTIAPTRSGKGVGAVIPNLLISPRSIVCIDPKGENAAIAASARARLGPVHVLDPFGASGQPAAAFNPLASLDPDSADLSEDAYAIADALVHDPPGQGGEAHWNEEAKALIAGIILYVVTRPAGEAPTLSAVREHLTAGPDRMLALLDDMAASPAAGGLVARAAHRHLSKSEREAAGVLSSAQRHTHFLDSPRMTAAMQRSDFAFEDLKTDSATVFLVLPPDRLATHARWLRLVVVQALFALARSRPSATATVRSPVLFLLDEFAALGHLQPVLTAFGLMAGYGVQLWVILQDLHQLKGAYGRSAGTFLSNAGLVQIFNVADVDTAAWVSRSLGTSTESFETFSASTSRGPRQLSASRSASINGNLTRRDLMTPDEVMRLGPDRLLLLRPGSPPTLAQKLRYYQDPEFQGFFKAALDTAETA